MLYEEYIDIISGAFILADFINSLRPSEAYMHHKHTIIGSDNGLSPGWCQAIIWTSAGILLIWPSGTNFSEMLIEIHTFSFKKCVSICHLGNDVHFVSASMWFFFGLNVFFSASFCFCLCYVYLMFIIPPAQWNFEGSGGDIFFSLCLFVSPSVPHAVSALWRIVCFLDYIHIWHK